MTLDKEQIWDAIEKGEKTDTDKWRWGTLETYVFPHEDKFYQFSVRFQPEEGCQDEEAEAFEVKKVEIKSYKWEKV